MTLNRFGIDSKLSIKDVMSSHRGYIRESKGSFLKGFSASISLYISKPIYKSPTFFIMANSTKSVIKLRKLRQNRILYLNKKLEEKMQGYDHLLQFQNNNLAILKSDWVDENIRIIIIKHNYEINQTKKMKIKEFNKREIREVENEI